MFLQPRDFLQINSSPSKKAANHLGDLWFYDWFVLKYFFHEWRILYTIASISTSLNGSL